MIELVSAFNGHSEVWFRILTQTEKEILFNCSNGWILKTMSCPEVRESNKMLYLRGTRSEQDNKKMLVSLEIFKQIQEAIKEYNASKITCEKKENKMVMEISFIDGNITYQKKIYSVPEKATYFNGTFTSSEELVGDRGMMYDEYGNILITIPKKTVTKYLWEVGGLWITKEYFTAEEIQKRSNMLNMKKVKGSEKEVEV
jgi:hypothetical protein